ncbi:acetolactate decarboxylase [Streptococcus saliviloxodontae]|uniref:Alpha-acetolactate decarboxylase n=1 Tax=Streptococcus saliviloxodontae TaxID=1349416 RepID=A0ABS2PNS4_9STRE|nr:acetolactate decarboxylase [Streptococcus saliviloxodontae]MBM7636606.1 acetolactate decarboxylase [Streptococcus saliviloxodontae]
MSEAIKLFQYNTLGALMAGLYGGSLTIGELLEHGDLGIGTLDSIDGELIILDGKAYQAKGSDGKPEVVEVSHDEKVPYAAVVPHQAEVIFRQRFEMSDKELQERIESYYDGVNLFRSIKIKGRFKKMHVRMIPKSAPDTKFADVATRQPEYTKEEVSGTIVGIWTPEMFHGVSVAGYHLHFISDDHTFGGHVMDFIIEEGLIEVGPVDQLDQRFPVQDRQYLFAKFNVDEMREDITKSE